MALLAAFINACSISYSAHTRIKARVTVMAGSKFSLSPVKRAGDDFEARGRQLLAVEADIEAGRLSEAASMLNEIAKASPKDARVYITGWLLGNKAGNPAASLYSARRAVELAPMSAMAHFCLGESERSGGNPAAASASSLPFLMPDQP